MKIFLPVLTFICIVQIARAQTVTSKYDWDPKPKPHTITAAEAANKEAGLKDHRILEYVYDDAKKTDLVMYYTKHTIVKVNSAEGIEEFNRIYIPVSGVMEIAKIKARSISKDGKVVTLGMNDIKTAENDEGGGNYKYFAIEGLEPGSEVEYLYSLKYDANFYGNEKLQGDYIKHDVAFDLYVPGNFIFGTRSYNGLQEMKEDTTNPDVKHWSVQVDQMPALRKERYAAYSANLQRVEYSLFYNTAVSDRRMLDFGAGSTVFYKQYFDAEDKEVSDVAKFLKKINPQGNNDREKIIWVDNYLKENIAIQSISSPDLSDIRKIIDKKAASRVGIMRLYIQIADQMKLNPELVLTTDRSNVRFDGSFQTWNYFDEVIIYLPSLDIYLAPDNFTVRNGLPPPECEDNDGYFIKKITVGDLTSGVGKVKHINPADWRLSHQNITADVTLAEPFDEVKVHVKQEFAGHDAEFVQAYYDFLNDEQKQKLLDPVVNLIGADGKVSNLKVTNQLNEKVDSHPFIIESDISIASLIEKAGNNILFKIGNLLGEQVEMYSEEARQNEVENEYCHGYHRVITVNIPPGYTLKNPEALNLNVEAKDGDATPFYFHASYKIEGSKVTVDIQETYSIIHYPLSKYEDFRKVINAAADWNKVVLIFQKS